MKHKHFEEDPRQDEYENHAERSAALLDAIKAEGFTHAEKALQPMNALALLDIRDALRELVDVERARLELERARAEH